MRQRKAYEFPAYTPGERIADALIHILGVLAAVGGAAWLVPVRAAGLPPAEWLSLLAYAAALGGTMIASMAYHFAHPGRLKEILRRVDHAMIFAMIAGTFTPFAAQYARTGGDVRSSLWIVWGVALAGIALKLAFPRRFERAGLVLYLGLGWALAPLAWPVWASLATPSLVLLGVGGLLYALGTVLHLMESVRYHNAAWHGVVLVAAACHFAAVVLATMPAI